METYGLGTEVIYRDCHGEVRQGRIVGCEHVDNPRFAKVGLNFIIRTADTCDWVHHSSVVGKVQEPTYVASIFG